MSAHAVSRAVNIATADSAELVVPKVWVCCALVNLAPGFPPKKEVFKNLEGIQENYCHKPSKRWAAVRV
jgi:hypothetical protein